MPDCRDVSLDQDGAVMRASIMRPTRATLLRLVLHVVGVCSEEKMVRVNTGRIIASMANLKTRSYRPIFQTPRYAVGASRSAAFLDAAIAIGVSACLPVPAVVRAKDVNMFPKPARYRDRPAASSVRVGDHGVAVIAPPLPVHIAPPMRMVRLAAIWNRAYAKSSHFDTSYVLTWSGLKLVLTHRFGPLFMPENSETYNVGRA